CRRRAGAGPGCAPTPCRWHLRRLPRLRLADRRPAPAGLARRIPLRCLPEHPRTLSLASALIHTAVPKGRPMKSGTTPRTTQTAAGWDLVADASRQQAAAANECAAAMFRGVEGMRKVQEQAAHAAARQHTAVA